MNKTQCPNCVTDYVISDEQLRLSQGKVRCGKCLEQFDAYAELNKQKVVFDPRSAFIEPLSHYEEEHLNVGVDDILPDSRSVEFKDSSVSPVKVGDITPSNHEATSEKDLIPDEDRVELNEILKKHARDAAVQKKAKSTGKISGEPLRPNVNSDTLNSLADNFDPELSVHLYDDDFTIEPSVKEEGFDHSTRFLDPSTEFSSPSVRMTESSIRFDNDYIDESSIQHLASKNDSVSSPGRVEPQLSQVEIELEDIEQTSETVMLDEVRHSSGIEEPIFPDNQESVVQPPKLEENHRDIRLNVIDDVLPSNELNIHTTKKFRIWAWILSPILLLFIATLSIAFTYQLWQKQFISWPDRPEIRSTLEPITEPVLEKLNELDIVLPERRSLSLLQLLSAKTEAHPTRSSTLLLRISLINRAAIQQPLPWLELSLNNSDGKIISRRSLSPKDYIHNNRIDDSINPNELKKVTIELLSFPKHAAGFELRLLNK